MADRELKLKITVNGKTAEREIKRTDEELEKLKREARSAGDETEDSMEEVADEVREVGEEAQRLRRRLNRLDGRSVEMDGRFDTSAIRSKIEQLEREKIEIDVETDRDMSVRRRRGRDDARLPGELDEVQEAATFLTRLPPQIQALIAATVAAASALGLAGGLAAVATQLAAELGPKGLQNDIKATSATLKEAGRDFATEFEGVINDVILPAGRGFARLVRGMAGDAADFTRATMQLLQNLPGALGPFSGAASAIIGAGQQESNEDLVNRQLREALQPLRIQIPAMEQAAEADPGLGRQDVLEQRISALEEVRTKLFQLQQQFPDVVLATEEFPEPFRRVLTLLEQSRTQLEELKTEAAGAGDSLMGPVEQVEPSNDIIPQDMPDLEDMRLNLEVDGVEDARAMLEGGLIDSINRADMAIQSLQQAYDQASTQKTRDEIQALINRLQKHRDEMTRVQKQFVNFSPAIEKAAEEALVKFGQGIGEMMSDVSTASDVGREVLGTLANLAERVGRIAIGAGIAVEGIKRALQSLNPVAAIAAGTALIALAATVRSQLSSAAEQDGGAGTDQDRANVPRMNQGGEVEGGTPLLVGDAPGGRITPHTELFVPGESGTIVSSDQVQSMRTMVGAASMARPAGTGRIERKLDEVAERFERKQFRLRGTDQVTQQERAQAELDDAGIK